MAGNPDAKRAQINAHLERVQMVLVGLVAVLLQIAHVLHALTGCTMMVPGCAVFHADPPATVATVQTVPGGVFVQQMVAMHCVVPALKQQKPTMMELRYNAVPVPFRATASAMMCC
jgi:hypothetical protein